jgi:hypothetical protein
MDKRNQGQKTTCAKFVFMDMLLMILNDDKRNIALKKRTKRVIRFVLE